MKEPVAKRLKTEREVDQRHESGDGVWGRMDAPLASKVADYLELEGIGRLSCTSKRLHGFFDQNVINNVVNQLNALQAVLRLENIDGMRQFLFDNDSGKVSLKPRVKREIQAIFRLCEVHRICTDAYTSFLWDSKWTWPEEHQTIGTTLADCQQAVNPWLFKSNMIDVMLAYSDIFLMLKDRMQHRKANWDHVNDFARTRLGQAQKNAGQNYVNTILTASWKVGGEIRQDVLRWFNEGGCGQDYYLVVGASARWGGSVGPAGKREPPHSPYRGICTLLPDNSNSHTDLITASLNSLLKQESNFEENFSELKSLNP